MYSWILFFKQSERLNRNWKEIYIIRFFITYIYFSIFMTEKFVKRENKKKINDLKYTQK